MESVTGAVRVNATLRAAALVTIETHSGDVELRIPARAPLRLDADAATVLQLYHQQSDLRPVPATDTLPPSPVSH